MKSTTGISSVPLIVACVVAAVSAPPAQGAGIDKEQLNACINEAIDPDLWNGQPTAQVTAHIGDAPLDFRVVNTQTPECMHLLRPQSLEVTTDSGYYPERTFDVDTAWSLSGGGVDFSWTVGETALLKEVVGVRVLYEHRVGPQQWAYFGGGREWRLEIEVPNGHFGFDVAVEELDDPRVSLSALQRNVRVWHPLSLEGDLPTGVEAKLEIWIDGILYHEERDPCDVSVEPPPWLCSASEHLTVEPGAHLAEVWIDREWKLWPEPSERRANNYARISFTVPPNGPELRLNRQTSASRILSDLVVGQPVLLEVVAHNRGNIVSPRYEIAIDGKELGGDVSFVASEELRVTGRDYYDLPWVPEAEGSAEITVTIDPDNQIPERVDETGNNTVTFLAYVGVSAPSPDLFPVVSTPGLSGLRPGEPVSLDIEIHNTGTADSPPYEIHLDSGGLGGDLVIESTGNLEQGNVDYYPDVVWVPANDGSATVSVTVDPGDEIAESEEDNNTVTFPVQVVPLPVAPNLLITPSGIRMSPASPTAGETLRFDITVQNSGLPTSEPVDLIVQAGTTASLLTCPPIGALPCVKRHSVEAVPGTQSLTVTLDPGNDIVEIDEDDNERTITYNVPGGGGSLTCQGNWVLTGIGSNDLQYEAPGSVVDDCDVYWAQNVPDGTCWVTTGINGWWSEWFREGGSACPTRVLVHTPNADWEYSIVIE